MSTTQEQLLDGADVDFGPTPRCRITPETMRAIIARVTIESKRPDSKHIADYLEIIVATGINPTQAAQLTLSDISYCPWKILVPHGKIVRITRSVDSDAVEILSRIRSEAYQRGVRLDGCIFSAGIHKVANAAIGEICLKMGIQKFKCQLLVDFHREHTGRVWVKEE